MTHMTSGSESGILKTDARGRVRTSGERREQLLQEFARSGVSAPKFAQLAGIHYHTFMDWIQRQKKGLPSAKAADPPPGRVQWLGAIVEKRATATDSSTASLVRVPLEADIAVEYEAASQTPHRRNDSRFVQGSPFVLSVRGGHNLWAHPFEAEFEGAIGC